MNLSKEDMNAIKGLLIKEAIDEKSRVKTDYIWLYSAMFMGGIFCVLCIKALIQGIKELDFLGVVGSLVIALICAFITFGATYNVFVIIREKPHKAFLTML